MRVEQALIVSRNAHRRTGAGFHPHHDGFFSLEALKPLTEILQAFAQSLREMAVLEAQMQAVAEGGQRVLQRLARQAA